MRKVPIISLVLTGEIPSKKNMYRMGNGNFYTPEEVTDWMEDIGWQIKSQLKGRPVIREDCQIAAHFYITKDKDLDNMLNSLFDGLQSAGVINNDKQFQRVTAAKTVLDKTSTTRPHVEVSIEPVMEL